MRHFFAKIILQFQFDKVCCNNCSRNNNCDYDNLLILVNFDDAEFDGFDAEF